MKSLFNFLTLFDWISPAVAIAQDLAHPIDAWTFFIPWQQAEIAGWGEYQIHQVLAANGIETWGGLLFNGEYIIKVKLSQAAYAEYVLNYHGIPLAARCATPPEIVTMSNLVDFAPTGAVRVGPSLFERVVGWLFGGR